MYILKYLRSVSSGAFHFLQNSTYLLIFVSAASTKYFWLSEHRCCIFKKIRVAKLVIALVSIPKTKIRDLGCAMLYFKVPAPGHRTLRAVPMLFV